MKLYMYSSRWSVTANDKLSIISSQHTPYVPELESVLNAWQTNTVPSSCSLMACSFVQLAASQLATERDAWR